MRKLLVLLAIVLVKNTASAQIINNPESVEYDVSNDRYLISNRANPISIQSLLPGQTPTLFTSSVSSPAGLEILNGKLWVCDGGSLKSFDLSNGALVDNIAVGGTFLNGITSNGVDLLYVSDFTAKKIYEINTFTASYTEIVSNTGTSPNGMWYDALNNRVLFVNWGANAPIKAIDLSDNTVTTAATTSLGNCDGIARDAAGNYFVSAWTQGAVYKFDVNLANPVAVVSSLTQPADIYYNVANDTLAVPQTSADLITFHNFSTANVEESNFQNTEINLYPNPANTSFTLRSNSSFMPGESIAIYSLSGQLIFERAIEKTMIGKTELTIYTHELPEGSYIIELRKSAGRSRSIVQVKH